MPRKLTRGSKVRRIVAFDVVSRPRGGGIWLDDTIASTGSKMFK